MKNFCIITNKDKDPGLTLTYEIERYIGEKGGTAIHLLSASAADDNGQFSVGQIPKSTECIMVLGGDGTLIRTATKVEALQIPLIGVNLGTLGYLCELEESTVFQAIDCMLQDQFTLEDRIMLRGFKAGESSRRLAMNDIVIHHGGSMQILNLNVYVNGEFLTRYDADGIIVATPTGSTGYSMSAGGPIVDPKGDMLLLTPNNAHNLNSKSIVLSGDDTIEIEVISRRNQGENKLYVSFDGDRAIQLSYGERVVIQRSTNRIQICKIHKRSFLEILRKKMGSYTT